jgi:hypothetical protein
MDIAEILAALAHTNRKFPRKALVKQWQKFIVISGIYNTR